MSLFGMVLWLSTYWQSIHHPSLGRDDPHLELGGKKEANDVQLVASTKTCPKSCPSQYTSAESLYVCCNRGRCSKAVTDCPPPYGACQSCSVTVIVNGNSSAPIVPVPVTTDDCAMSSIGWIAGSSRIGNGLSTYWHALGVAAVTGQPFRGHATMGGSTFMGYLPTQWDPPDGWRGDAEKAKAACHCARPQFAHECVGAWTEARGLIRDFVNDTLYRAGLAQRALADTLPDEVFLHQRCAWETLLLHNMYGPMSFSVFRDAVKSTTTRVTFIEGKAGGSWLCDKIRHSVQGYIRKYHPDVSFRVLLGEDNPDSISMDFARLVYAPILVRGPSSFNLWAALANQGQVYSPPNPHTWGWTTTDLGSDWHWVTEARVLTRAIARDELNFLRPKESEPPEVDGIPWTDVFMERAMPWLQEDPRWFKPIMSLS
ncbi:hypothetical protein FOZ61_010240 [Perkinsus olseni]|uniref:Uncharacterized protein n=1 Tax=Perkinsus olseni TaxID=32597 RepID=A0A7J6KYQ8_PEROL|nr:hypothetical protein FOZ61_010240 [Perkinsus olseni]KAF4653516.1 hypothetical protein FOL46_009172 [Perkinsus olseni]